MFNVAMLRPAKVEGADDAARSLVYNIFVATDGAQEPWRPLWNLDESVKAVAQAAGLGWIVVFTTTQKITVASVRAIALTDEGRRIARKRLH
jgi:hypothetical protein